MRVPRSCTSVLLPAPWGRRTGSAPFAPFPCSRGGRRARRGRAGSKRAARGRLPWRHRAAPPPRAPPSSLATPTPLPPPSPLEDAAPRRRARRSPTPRAPLRRTLAELVAITGGRTWPGRELAMRMRRLLEKLRFGSQTFLLYATQTDKCISRLGRDCWRQSYHAQRCPVKSVSSFSRDL